MDNVFAALLANTLLQTKARDKGKHVKLSSVFAALPFPHFCVLATRNTTAISRSTIAQCQVSAPNSLTRRPGCRFENSGLLRDVMHFASTNNRKSPESWRRLKKLGPEVKAERAHGSKCFHTSSRSAGFETHANRSKSRTVWS